MFSDSAGNHRIISDNFIKSTGKIGECMSTVPACIRIVNAQYVKSIQLHARING